MNLSCIFSGTSSLTTSVTVLAENKKMKKKKGCVWKSQWELCKACFIGSQLVHPTNPLTPMEYK